MALEGSHRVPYRNWRFRSNNSSSPVVLVIFTRSSHRPPTRKNYTHLLKQMRPSFITPLSIICYNYIIWVIGFFYTINSSQFSLMFHPSLSTTSRELRKQFAACSGSRQQWLERAKALCINHDDQKVIFKASYMCLRLLWIFLFFQCGDRLYTSESDV